MNAVRTIAARELRALFDHPTGYILLIVFVSITDFMFFGQVFLLGAASMRPMLDLLPWILLFFVPAVTMRSLAEDSRTGILEVVLAQPVTELELLAGKFVGYLAFVWIGLALTLPIPMGLSLGADLHLGVIFAQYAGSALLAMGLVGVGIWASSGTPNQITAFILAIAVVFGLILVGLNPLITGLPASLGALAANLSVLAHFENINRGVLDLRDVVYFLTLTGVFFGLAYFAVLGRRLSRRREARRRLQLGTIMIVVTLVIVNLFGRHIGGRLDLTPGKAYTLSPAMKTLLGDLDELLTITFYVSDEVPHGLEFMKRDIEDLLRDFRRAGDGNVRVMTVDPSEDDETAQEARSAGVQPVQFNVIGKAALSVSEGYLGLALQYADAQEAIPFVTRSDDLEFQLASLIRSMTRTDQQVVGFVEQPAPSGATYNQFRQALNQQYDVVSLSVEDSTPIGDEIRTLVMVGSPMFLTDSQADRFSAFFERGGGALVMASGMVLQQQGLMASPSPVGWNRILTPFGVSIQPNLVYDLASNEFFPVSVSGGRAFLPYPFWVRAVSTRSAAPNRDVETATFPWVSAIAVADSAAHMVTPLFTTTEAGGSESGQAFVTPQREYNQDSLRVEVLSVMVNPLVSDSSDLQGRVIVVGNSDFLSDGAVQRWPGGYVFALNAVDWLAQDEALIGIRSKNRQPPPLAFESEVVRDFVKWGNVVGVPLMLVLLGAFRLVRRRRRIGTVYTPAPKVAV
ncbi:MAG: Gldg family protein [Gemmatimonadales bacterium]